MRFPTCLPCSILRNSRTCQVQVWEGCSRVPTFASMPEMCSNTSQWTRWMSLGAKSALLPRRPLDMATYVNGKSSDNADSKAGAAVYTLDEKRRAVLAEIDNAKFSHVFLIIIAFSSLTGCSIPGGFTSRSAWSLVSVFSQMRKFAGETRSNRS